MKTSRNNTEAIETYLTKSLAPEEHLVFEAQLLLDSGLREQTQWQQASYEVIRDYGRRQLKQELAGLHQQLFSMPEHRSFKERILKLF